MAFSDLFEMAEIDQERDVTKKCEQPSFMTNARYQNSASRRYFHFTLHTLLLRTHMREQQHISNRWRIGEQHNQAVDTNPLAGCWR